MAMTLTANGGPTGNKAGIVPGRAMPRQSLAGVPVAGVSNLWWKSVCVDLENSAYETGGIPFELDDIGMKSIHDMYVYAGKDPYNQGDAHDDYKLGLTFKLGGTPQAPTLMIYDETAEEAATTTHAGDVVWLLVGGTV